MQKSKEATAKKFTEILDLCLNVFSFSKQRSLLAARNCLRVSESPLGSPGLSPMLHQVIFPHRAVRSTKLMASSAAPLRNGVLNKHH